jgi:hypothetical protein
MITITEKAIHFIGEKNNAPIFLDVPPLIGGCIHLKECPSVQFGEPREIEKFDRQTIQGIILFVPHEISDIDLTINLSSFLGFKKLVVEGWHLA